MKINKDELRGIESTAGFNVLFKLLLGAYTVPFISLGQDMDTFIASFEGMDLEHKRAFLKRALAFVELDTDEKYALLRFCKDKNGVEYSRANVQNLRFDEVLELCLDVLTAYSEVKLFF